jgi:hypothetical protein
MEEAPAAEEALVVVAARPGGAPAVADIVLLDDTNEDNEKPMEAITGKKHRCCDGPGKM